MLVSDSVWIPRGAHKLPFGLSALRVRSLGNTSSIQVHSFIGRSFVLGVPIY